MEYREVIKGLASQYDECPIQCVKAKKQWDAFRPDYCKTCPRRKQKDIYKAQTREGWNKIMGEDAARKFDFDHMHQVVMSITNLTELPADKIGLKSSILVSTYLTLKSRRKQ